MEFYSQILSRATDSTMAKSPLESHQSLGISQSNIPSGYVKIAIENGPFIVDLPIEGGDFP